MKVLMHGECVAPVLYSWAKEHQYALDRVQGSLKASLDADCGRKPFASARD
jgi:hypothetical protein